MVGRTGPRCRFDHTVAGSRRSVELVDPVGELVAWEPGEVVGVLEEAERRASGGCWLGGFVAYEAAPAFDPALRVRADPPSGDRPSLPLAWFGVYRGCGAPSPGDPLSLGEPGGGASDGDGVGGDGVGGEGAEPWVPEIDPAAHAAGVGSVREAIAAGDVYLLNYTTRLRRPWPAGRDPQPLYDRVRAAHRGGLHAYLETDDWAVACGSPELFVDLDGGTVTTGPMKGTRPRGRWLAEDLAHAEALHDSPKERAENVMVVDLLRNDLGRIAEVGTVRVPRLWRVERYPAVWQLTSTVTARAPGAGLAEVFGALFPCGSVTGAPKVAAMRLAAELETSPRGVYCGAVGLIRPPLDGAPGGRPAARFAVAIRTAVVDKRREVAEYGSGGGITWDSDPQAEWEEVRTKAGALRGTGDGGTGDGAAGGRRGPGDAGLIETMHADAAGVRNLAGHVRRLAGSCFYLGFPPPTGVAARLRREAAGLDGPARLRLVWCRDGRVEVSASPLGAAAGDGGPLRLCVDAEPVSSADPGLFHKTTDRARYDRRAARHPGADDVVLVNERGEVTETTRANLLVLLDGRWCTPALDCGLLPGVERERLLAAGGIEERAITVTELLAAGAVETVSSLRGRRPAQVVACAHPCASRPDGNLPDGARPDGGRVSAAPPP